MNNTKTIDANKLDSIIKEIGSSQEAIIPLLQKIQTEFGYVPFDAMQYVTAKTEIMPTEIYGVATFFKQFRFTPVGKYLIKVCHGTACHVKGAEKISTAISDEIDICDGKTSKDGLFTLENVACLGCCSLAPVIMIGDKVYGRLTPDSTRKILRQYKFGEIK